MSSSAASMTAIAALVIGGHRYFLKLFSVHEA
jgi:hypothetical protein